MYRVSCRCSALVKIGASTKWFSCGAIRNDRHGLLLKAQRYISTFYDALPILYHTRHLLQLDGYVLHSAPMIRYVERKCVRLLKDLSAQSPDLFDFGNVRSIRNPTKYSKDD